MGFTHLSRICITTTPTSTELFGHMSSLSFLITFLINSFLYWHSVSIFSRAQKVLPPFRSPALLRPPRTDRSPPPPPPPTPITRESPETSSPPPPQPPPGSPWKGGRIPSSTERQKSCRQQNNNNNNPATKEATNCVLTFDVPPSKSVAE